jgi:hypothetical protein
MPRSVAAEPPRTDGRRQRPPALRYAEPDTKPKGQTASELAADLMFDGPGDLSTNAKYMAGYGRDARHR